VHKTKYVLYLLYLLVGLLLAPGLSAAREKDVISTGLRKVYYSKANTSVKGRSVIDLPLPRSFHLVIHIALPFVPYRFRSSLDSVEQAPAFIIFLAPIR
jgi:hypothetical protein